MTKRERTIERQCDEIKRMLLRKARSYGDSINEPVRVFSRADRQEALLVRIDDKLSRISKGNGDLGEDTILDLVGYLILLMIARKGKA